MKKWIPYLSIALSIMAIACSKTNEPLHPIDPPMGHVIAGKWIFYSSVGIDQPYLGLYTSAFPDTLVFSPDSNYFIIKAKDTIDLGAYGQGYGNAMNGFGRMQYYDSLLLKSNSIAQNAPLNISYFHLADDTLCLSTLYFKDSSAEKAYVRYIRSK